MGLYVQYLMYKPYYFIVLNKKGQAEPTLLNLIS